MSSKLINTKKYSIKEKIINDVNYDFQKGLDNEIAFTDAELDSIVENIIESTDRTERLEPFSSKIIPKGKNSQRTKKNYYHKRYYDEHAFPKPSKEHVVPGDEDFIDDQSKYQGTSRNIFIPFSTVDFVHDKAYYGRLDTNNYSIYPSEKFLKLVNTTTDVFLIDIVADALNDMLAKIELLKETGKLTNQSVYFKFKPKKGWESLLQDHHKTMNSIYEGFVVKYANNPEMFKKIRSFEDYSRQFVSFLNQFLPKFPISRTNLLLRRATNPRISGITFEIATDPHDDDEKKYTKYILDKHFLQIQNIANGYGFMVDRNAPWRFTADLESPQMKARMADKNIGTLQDFFDKCYYKAHLYEVDSLRNYFNSFYDSFIEGYPYYTIVEKCGAGSKAKLLYRSQRAKDHFSDRKLLEFYYYVRAKESHKDWSQEMFDREVEEAYQIFTHYDFIRALNFINDKTTHIHGLGGNPGFRTKKVENDRIIHTHQSSHKRNSFTIVI